MSTLIWFCLLVGGWIISSEASIYEYKNQTFTTQANARYFQGGSEGLYTSASIRFDDVTFVRTIESAGKRNATQQTTGLVEAILLEGRDSALIGGVFLNDSVVCCTPELADTGSCSLGEVIKRRDPNDPEWPRQIKTFFKGNNTEAKMSSEAVVINKTGMYYLYFMICDPELDGTVIKGTTVWKNPYGYLPGKVAPLRNFFGYISLAYLLLGLVWFLRFAQRWKDGSMTQLHYHITLVIALGMCEMVVQYFEYADFNSTGMRPMELTLCAVTFSAMKKTLSRLLLLVVSMGYRGLKPTLGRITSRVCLLGLGVIVYFVATMALELVQHLGNINDFPGMRMISLMIPVALLDACFLVWIFLSLARTLEKLQIRRNVAKLKLYRNFTNALSVSVLLSTAWIGFEVYFYAVDAMSRLRMAWIIPAGSSLLFYGLLAVQCDIWAELED